MSKRTFRAVLAALACLMLAAGGVLALSLGDHAINWRVIGGGGGSVQSVNYGVNTTIGQPVAGFKASANYRLGSGYWYGAVAAGITTPTVTTTPTATPTSMPPSHLAYLPIVVKNCP